MCARRFRASNRAEYARSRRDVEWEKGRETGEETVTREIHIYMQREKRNTDGERESKIVGGKNINPRKATHVSPYRLRDAGNYESIPSQWSTIKSSSITTPVTTLDVSVPVRAISCVSTCKSRARDR